ncbi:hypothetical protein M1E17_06655 [Arthrobacter sp. D1-29]
MQHLLVALATTPTPLPTPTLREGISEDQITPGLWGFIMTAFFVLATTLLIVDMVRRIRRVRYRAQVEEERLAAAAAADVEAEDTGSYGRTPDTYIPDTSEPDTSEPAHSETVLPEPNGDAGRSQR